MILANYLNYTRFLLQPPRLHLHLVRLAHQGPLPLPAPRITSPTTPEETTKARNWIGNFKSTSIPRGAVELTFSRSSGPGGQNVNKLNTKATLRCPIDSPWIPIWAHPNLKATPHYVSSSNSLLVTCTVHRSQSLNVDECLSKLHAMVLTASAAPIRTEPSEEQKRRVADLERVERARRRQDKTRRSDIKKGRASGKRGGWD